MNPRLRRKSKSNRRYPLKQIGLSAALLAGFSSTSAYADETVSLTVTATENVGGTGGIWKVFEQNSYPTQTSGLAGIQFNLASFAGNISFTSSNLFLPTGSDDDSLGGTGFTDNRSNGAISASQITGIGAMQQQLNTINRAGDVTNIFTGVGNTAETINTGDDGSGNNGSGDVPGFITTKNIGLPFLLASGTYTGSIGLITATADAAQVSLLPVSMPAPTANGVPVTTFAPTSVVSSPVTEGFPVANWLLSQGGDWNTAGNWSSSYVPGNNFELSFHTGSNAPYTVGLSANSSALDTIGVSDQLTINLGGKSLSSTWTNVGQGSLKLTGGGQFFTGQFTLNSGGTITLDTQTSGFVTCQSVQANGGLLDLTNGSLTFQYAVGGGTPSVYIPALLSTSYHAASGPWTATTGITSSTAAANRVHRTIAFADGADGVVTNLPAGVSAAIPNGGTLPAGAYLVTYAYAGDANLDGKVDFADFVILSNHFGSTATKWDQGNFNYDGGVDFADFVILSNNFGDGVTSNGASATPQELAQYNALAASFGISQSQISAWDAQIAALPEPGAMGIFAFCGVLFALAGRRPLRAGVT
ncbi:MAG: hypothetical protein M3O30_08885 [Planctomycetota bacterium]|nr:hypothetical protein [Planctomycetota bacterium]